MKLLLGKTLIETDHIETVERMSPQTVKIQFRSGKTLEVVCGMKTTHPAVSDQDADGFIQTLLNTETYEKKKPHRA